MAESSTSVLSPSATAPTKTKLPRLFGEVFWVGLGQILAASGSLVGVKLLTSILSPSAYGELALGLTAVLLANQVLFGPLSNAVARFFAPAQESGSLTYYLESTWRLVWQCSIITLIIAALCITAAVVIFGIEWLNLLILAVFFALISGVTGIMDSMQNAGRQRTVVALHQGSGQWLRFAAGAAAACLLGATGSAALLGFLIAGLFVMLSQWICYRRFIAASIPTLPPDPDKVLDLRASMLEYAWPFSIFGIVCWLQVSSDRWAIQACVSQHDVGVYAALYQIGYTPAVLINGMLLQLLAPIFYARAGDCGNHERVNASRRMIWQLMACTGIATALGTALCWLLHAHIFSLLVAPQYQSISTWLPVMFLAGGLFACAQTGSLRQMTEYNTRALMAPKIGSSLIGILLNCAGAYWYGLKGVIFANLAYGFIYLCWILFSILRQSPTEKMESVRA